MNIKVLSVRSLLFFLTLFSSSLIFSQSGYCVAKIARLSAPETTEPTFGLRMPKLTSAELQEMDSKLKLGESVVVQRKVKGNPWPEVFVYSLVNASTEDAIAFLFDFEAKQVTFPDHVLGSGVVDNLFKSTDSPNVRYSVRLFPTDHDDWNVKRLLKDNIHDDYVLRHKLTRKMKLDESGKSSIPVYCIEAELQQESKMMHYTAGYVYVEPYGDHQTLSIRHSYIVPRFREAAKWFKNRALGKASDLSRNEKESIEKQAPEDLARRKRRLNEVLSNTP